MTALLHKLLSNTMMKYWDFYQLYNTHFLIYFCKKGPKRLIKTYNSRGVSQLSVVGKLFTRLFLSRLLARVAPDILPDLQCGFRLNVGTADMIFIAVQLQEKYREQHVSSMLPKPLILYIRSTL